MAGPAAILRETHRLRRHAKDLQSEIERSPRVIKGQQAKVARQEELYREAQEALKHLKVTVKEKEADLKATYAQIAKHEKQLNEAAAKKEYDALKAEIAGDRKKCLRLEDEILEGMAETDERAAQLPEMDKAIKKAKEEAAQFEKEAQTRVAGLQEQLQKAQQQLKEVEATLPEDVHMLYERQVEGRGEDALSSVQDRNCAACYTAITAQSYNDLLAGRLVVCKSCGRILYLPE